MTKMKYFSSIISEVIKNYANQPSLVIIDELTKYDISKDDKNNKIKVIDEKSLFPNAISYKELSMDSKILDKLIKEVSQIHEGIICLFTLIGRFKKTDEFRKHPQGHLTVIGILIYEILMNLSENVSLFVITGADTFLSYYNKDLCNKISHDFNLSWLLTFEEHPFVSEIHPLFKFGGYMISHKSNISLTRVVSIPSLNEDNTSKIRKDIRNLSNKRQGYSNYGYVLENNPDIGTPWTFDSLNPKWKTNIEELAKTGEIKKIHDYFEVINVHGPFFQRKNTVSVKMSLNRTCNDIQINSYVITGRDIKNVTETKELLQESFTFGLENNYKIVKINEQRYLHPLEKESYSNDSLDEIYLFKISPGDLITQNIVDLKKLNRLKIITIPKTDLEILGTTFIVLRPKDDEFIDGQDKELLLLYLRSKFVINWLQDHNISRIHLYTGTLKNLPIPHFHDDLKAAIKYMNEASKKLKDWQIEINNAKKAIFDSESVFIGYQNLLKHYNIVQERVNAANRVDTFSWKVRNLYPYPLAIKWRKIESCTDIREKYDMILKTSEILLTYISIVGMVLARKMDLKVSYLKTVSKRLKKRPKAGFTFGDWLSILKEIIHKKQIANLGAKNPLFEISDLKDDEFIQSLHNLKEMRDNYAHGRGPNNEIEYKKQIEVSLKQLILLFRKIDFLSKYPLRFVEDINYNQRVQEFNYIFLEVIGDHHLFSRKNERGVKPLGNKCLYLYSTQKQYLLIHPWLIRQQCPKCGKYSIFLFDNMDAKSNNINLKSLETGHLLNGNEYRKDFEEAGII